MTSKRAATWIAAIVLALTLIGVGSCASDSGVPGAPSPEVSAQTQEVEPDQRTQNSDPERRLAAAQLTDLFEAVAQRDAEIDVFTEELTDAEGREEEDLDSYRKNLRDAIRSCEAAVKQYDVLSEFAGNASWRPSNLPRRIDRSRSSYDCKASQDQATPAPSKSTREETGAGEPSPAPASS